MEKVIEEVLFYILKCIYFIVPGAFAVMTPIFVKDHFKWLAIPVDFGKTFKGKPLFGKNKTYRGFVSGVLVCIIFAYLQKFLYQSRSFHNLSFVDYYGIDILLFGFLMGFGALFGDLVKSFFKRQIGIDPGKPFMPWDQIDSVIGGFVFILPLFRPTLIMFVTVLIVSFLIHITNRTIAYKLKLSKDRW